MNQEVLQFTIDKTHELVNAFSCSAETKAAAETWLAAVGTENEASETQKYISELEADIMPIDTLISFAESEAGTKVFGDNAPNVASHAKEIKSHGAKYCDCPACNACAAILERKEEILK